VTTARCIEAADHLQLIAHLIDLQESRAAKASGQKKGRGFRSQAFARAAKEVRERGDERMLSGGVVGLGSSTKEVLEQFLATGTSDRMKQLDAELPGVVDAMTMTRVKGVGPVKAVAIMELGIPNFEALVAAAQAGTLDPSLERFKSAIIHAHEIKSGRIEAMVARPIAEGVLEQVLKFPGVIKAEICGSLRRRMPTIKDCDIVVSALPEHHAGIHEAFKAMGLKFTSGDVKTTIYVERFATTLQCDIWTVEPWWFGAALNYATGSKEHNIHLRAMAKRRGMRIDEKGIFRMLKQVDGRLDAKVDGLYQDGEKVAERLGGDLETDIYSVLGIPYVEPKDRV
jgi:DNA polymerase (family X)